MKLTAVAPKIVSTARSVPAVTRRASPREHGSHRRSSRGCFRIKCVLRLRAADRTGPALRELDVACLELEALGCPPEFALVVLLRGVGERIAVEHG
jgi:hypothetical protein